MFISLYKKLLCDYIIDSKKYYFYLYIELYKIY